MHIVVTGGGPGGLLFALLMKRQNSAHRVEVIEQNPADNTYGWGVVFSGTALGFLRERVPDVFDSLNAHLEIWDELTIVHRDEAMAVDGSTFSGIARQKLLDVLQHHCRLENVELRFNERMQSPDTVKDADLVVGADGVNSIVRDTDAEVFGTRTTELTNHFIWYGTTRVFDSLSLIFRENAHGHFVAHTYRYSPTMSTFLVECDAQTWANAGFESMTDEESIAYCEKVFAKDLQDNPLQSNQSSWRRFPMIESTTWHHNNRVLIGDALRTVHFSIGSGTRTAMEDAMMLADSFAQDTTTVDERTVQQSLERFVALRQPGARKLMNTATASMDWYEDFADLMRLEPWAFAWSYMTRGGRVSLEKLQSRSPRFAQACVDAGVTDGDD